MPLAHYDPRASYESRAGNFDNAAARALLATIARKRSNLSVAADVATKAELLQIADALGPSICVLKTHIDIVADFDQDLTAQLAALAAKHDFLVFEDRKFADIGNTVHLQYAGGVYKIADWAHITNAHSVPGAGIIAGLAKAGAPRGRGLLLLAEMSSEGTLAAGDYARRTVEMARAHRGFVFGFIGQRRLDTQQDWLILTPGVRMGATAGDGLGQQYRSPRDAIARDLCDVVIVGRGVYEGASSAAEMRARAEEYRRAAWAAYEERMSG